MEKKKPTEKKPYWTGHRERLRRRAKAGGLESLRPHEILEMLLGFVVPRVDLSETARGLITAFGSVEGVLSADRGELLRVPGVTPRMVDWLLTTRELVAAYCGVSQRAQFRIWRYRDLIQFLMPRWREVPPPQVWVIYTDYDDRLLCYMKLSDSLTVDSPACSRELMEIALVLEARYVYLVGFAGIEPLEFYAEEVEYIHKLSRMLEAIDVQLMDYVLVGESGFFSANKDGRYLDDARQTLTTQRLMERYLSDDEEGNDYDAGDSLLYEGEPGTL